MPRDQAFFWNNNNIAFRGRGRGKNRYSYEIYKKASQVCNFLNSFVQDCSYSLSKWQAVISLSSLLHVYSYVTD